MAWLDGWSKRIKLTIDHTLVDDDLINFPLLIKLSSSSGRNSFNATVVFDELSDYNFVTVSGVIHEYTMDSINGDVLIDTVGTNNGTILNSNIIDGRIGKALEFGSVASTLRNVVFDSNINNWWSLSFWAKRHNLSNTTVFFSNNTNSKNIACQESGNGNWLYTYDNGGNNSNLKIDDLNWHHIVCVRETASSLRFYLDSVAADSVVTWTVPGIKFIGRNNTITNQEVAMIDQVRFYDRKLTVEEINNLYNEELVVYGNKKIIITTSDNQPCYVEIDTWNWVSQEGTLWVKAPLVSSGSDTVLYMYYDKNQNNNWQYVGETGDIAAQRVWDDSFKVVYHFSPTSNCSINIKDSTFNNNIGTSYGNMKCSNYVLGDVGGKALDFDGVDDYLSANYSNSLNITEDITMEMYVKIKGFDNYGGLLVAGCWANDSPRYESYALNIDSSNTIAAYFNWNASGYIYTEFNSYIQVNEFYYIATTYDYTGDKKIRKYVDGSFESEESWAGPIESMDTSHKLYIAADAPGEVVYGEIVADEVRISDVARSDAWIKATYYTLSDNLIIFSGEELQPKYYIEGYVKERGAPVSRKVRIYDRETGQLMDEDTSRASDGYYYVTTTHSGEHFVVVFDDDEGEEYNALIADRLIPRAV